MKIKLLFPFLIPVLFGIFCAPSIQAQSYFTKNNWETQLGPFSTINGQWLTSNPTNNTLGEYNYQGINFGYDINNYSSLVNPIGTNDLYFGRWSGGWKGWRKIVIADENGNVGIGTTTPSAKMHIYNSFNTSNNIGLKMFYEGSWGTASYASNFRFIDISSTEGGKIFQLSGYGLGIGYEAPQYSSNDKLYVNGNVGIGTTTPDEKLTVKGKIHAQEVRVDLQGACAPDYVFQKYYTGKSTLKSDYVMPTLAEIESFTKKNHHLPNVPSAQEVQQNGVSLGEMSNVLLQKVEELTLYAIEQNKELERLRKENNVQSNEIKTLKKENEIFIYLSKRLTDIENQIK